LIFGGSASAASTTLVLSQVYGGGGGASGTYANDYVEVKNISNAAQSLNGLSLVYGSAAGQFASSSANAFALPNVTLNPGQFFLVQLGAAGSGGAALPVTPDATTNNLSMGGASGKVALVTSAFANNTCGATATPCTLPNAAIIDSVSYGAANNAEGGAPTNGGSGLASTQGNVRKNNGCQDTDNNNADFDVVSAPVPRNTSTTQTCGGGGPVNVQHVSDYNGDGKTDFAVVRNTGGGAGGAVTWFVNFNGTSTTYASDWGISTDDFIPADYDGDNKSDLAVWRSGAQAVFYILQSSDFTVRIDQFGQANDDASVVDDYDGDGKADVAVYREGANAGEQSVWYYRGSSNNAAGNITYVPWGQNGDFPSPGDYDGDNRADFVIQRNDGGGGARFWMLQTTAGSATVRFGTPSDLVVPGDYDGDGKTDIAVVRGSSGVYEWFYRPSSTGVVSGAPFATFGDAKTDYIVQGDYDGDGKTDAAIWRPDTTSYFWVLGSTGGVFSVPFGGGTDLPPASYNNR
jgi:hypothetical protein